MSDHNNALKTGFDPATGTWPDWFEGLDLPPGLLPEVRPAGAEAGAIAPDVARALDLSPETRIHLGTTDSIAAFLAAAPAIPGAAVTSLGTTLAVKLYTHQRIEVPAQGLYSHRVGDGWLVGGASNTGGGVLRSVFTDDQIAALYNQLPLNTRVVLYPTSTSG